MKTALKLHLTHNKTLILLLITLLIWSRGSFLNYLPLSLILLIAPFYEWIVHKYILHIRFKNEPIWFSKRMEELHRGHHKAPQDLNHLFAPLWASVTIPFQFILISYLITRNWDLSLSLGIFSLTYFLFYEWNHMNHHLHLFKAWTKRGDNLRKTHNWHHYKNENLWWGVTSIFGDKLLNTAPDVKDAEFSKTVHQL